MPDIPDTPLHRIRDDLLHRLRLYEDGTMTTQTRIPTGAVDTTSETIEKIRAMIVELDRVIEGQPR
jgi:hypothetical protein